MGGTNALINPLDLTDKLILITGASSGIGSASAIYLSKLGARIILIGRNEDRLHETYSALSNEGHVIKSFDLTQIDLIPPMEKSLAERYGPIHGLVHCAGIQQTAPIRNTTCAEMERMFTINVFSSMALLKGLRQKGVHAEKTSAVLLSSVMGIAGESCRTNYSASKGAVISLTRSAAVEMVRDGIRVNCIAPGFVSTPMLDDIEMTLFPQQLDDIQSKHLLGIGEPEDVASAIAFLISNASKWITGTTLMVDGGYTAR